MIVASAICLYEEGSLTTSEEVTLFAELVKTGLAWEMQGSYGRRAAAFIVAGLIDPYGNIDRDKLDLLESFGD